jgi:hypothetical protein
MDTLVLVSLESRSLSPVVFAMVHRAMSVPYPLPNLSRSGNSVFILAFHSPSTNITFPSPTPAPLLLLPLVHHL